MGTPNKFGEGRFGEHWWGPAPPAEEPPPPPPPVEEGPKVLAFEIPWDPDGFVVAASATVEVPWEREEFVA